MGSKPEKFKNIEAQQKVQYSYKKLFMGFCPTSWKTFKDALICLSVRISIYLQTTIKSLPIQQHL